jgi:hypothetical protein
MNMKYICKNIEKLLRHTLDYIFIIFTRCQCIVCPSSIKSFGFDTEWNAPILEAKISFYQEIAFSKQIYLFPSHFQISNPRMVKKVERYLYQNANICQLHVPIVGVRAVSTQKLSHSFYTCQVV